MKNHFCMPRFRTGANQKSTRRFTPVTLLDRFREAVFRLIMLSALSKANNGERRSSANSTSKNNYTSCYYSNDPHHSEAVADCIEFIKKSSTTDDNRYSTASTSSSSSRSVSASDGDYSDGTAQVRISLPAM